MIEFNDEDFKKSSLCNRCERCVTIASKGEVIAVRDSKDPLKTTLQFTKEEWHAFIEGVKCGEFDF